MIEVSVKGGAVIAADFRQGSARFAVQERKIVRKYGQLLNTRIKAKASGRPGPNAPTGDYRRSWGVDYYDRPAGPVAQVGTNEPQGMRLEYGFVGTDSLGRQYDQPPFPHVEPACDEIEPLYVAEMEKAVPY